MIRQPMVRRSALGSTYFSKKPRGREREASCAPHPRQWNSSKNRLQEGLATGATKYLLARTILTPAKMQSCRSMARSQLTDFFLQDRCLQDYKTVALVKRPFGMLRCAVAATLNRQ